MKPASSFFQEAHLRYIQRTLKVSRQEVISTIRRSHISARQIADYLRSLQQKHRGNNNALDHGGPVIV
ncbi:MAG TPA: hypothetical protein VMR70_02350 [Flavisolibacter sp.]|nr:hypothetical protein [Flavisolibacter sp.]